MSSFVPRAVCYRCHKPQITCICSSLPRVENRTPVFVLQHPRERLHPIGTARFASLGLANARVEVAWNAGTRETERPAWIPADAALLYPSPDARDLRELPAHERPRALVVLDGTWNTVRTLYREKRWLQDMPHFRFLPTAPGRYRLRREPQHDYVSTIEAIVEALGILEPETPGFPPLIAAFDAMIDQQLTYVGRGGAQSRVRNRRRPPEQRRVPHALVEGFERLIVLCGESSRPTDGHDHPSRNFVYFVALALGAGGQFERFTLPDAGTLDAVHLHHMGLTEADFAAAHGGEGFATAWAEFLERCGPAPILAAWNQRALEQLERLTGRRLPGVVLKSAYRAVFGTDAHNLEEIVEQRGITLEPTTLKGRAARRLGGAVAVARLLHTRASSENNRTSNIGHTKGLKETDP